ncbi:GNAT family N-acetyltransferase [Aestuariibaculum sediminum]|uniref:GNAT family N-acetyltransferase n=1 Tax=Aestuariibaculum sediminum TaxID=2770637 RepID=A0A8J6Q3H3_9FLAO|nr:GNAT family N-acetyltransferase [Aestuariibaculum sediminum]MBD0832405.1 GNAT family N-acetyltransferase [Aestuariibaculum sediminum]
MSKKLNYPIKTINASETIAVRHPVLRPGRPVETCHFDGDDQTTTFHFGIYNNNTLVGVVSYFKNNCKLLSNEEQYQLRGMAVLEPFQGKGLGKLLVEHGNTFLKNLETTVVWCNAREIALNFYKKNNFKIIGAPFEIKDIGLHHIMYKPLLK